MRGRHRLGFFRHDRCWRLGHTLARQRAEEGDQRRLLVRAERDLAQVRRQCRPVGDAVDVVLHGVGERGHRAVVHVGRAAADFAQARRLEGVLGLLQPQHRAAAAIVAVEPDVVEGVIRERPARVAVRA